MQQHILGAVGYDTWLLLDTLYDSAQILKIG